MRRLTDHPAGEEVMRRALAQPTTDAFTCGALAEGLGQRGCFAALPALRQIAEDRQQDQQLRAQALLALGLLNEQASETALIRLIADPHEDPTLRGMAAEHLPEQLSSEAAGFCAICCGTSAHPPRSGRQPRALGHVRDREAMPLMLRYGQDENAEIAQAAITALTDLGDGSVALCWCASHTICRRRPHAAAPGGRRAAADRRRWLPLAAAELPRTRAAAAAATGARAPDCAKSGRKGSHRRPAGNARQPRLAARCGCD